MTNVTDRVANVLNKNGMTVVEAMALSIAEWEALINHKGNGIGIATALAIKSAVLEQDKLSIAKPSKADLKAKDAIEIKANNLEQLVTYFCREQHTPDEVIGKIAAKAKDPRELSLAKLLLSHYLMLSLDNRRSIMNKLARHVYRNTVKHNRRDILKNTLISGVASSIKEELRAMATTWGARKILSDTTGGGANKFVFLGNVFVVVLLDVLELMKLMTASTRASTTSKHVSSTVMFSTKEFRLDVERDGVIVKYFLKTTRNEVTQYPLSYNDEGIADNGRSMYSGHMLKHKPAQSAVTINVLNKLQKYGYTLVPQMIDPNHYMGKQVRKIAKAHYEKVPTGYEDFCTFLDEYTPGTVLYSQCTVTPDNGRIDYRGWPVGLNTGALSWIFQQSTEIALTETEVAKLIKRIKAFDGGKLGKKEEMEQLHYMAALEAHNNGETTGVITSNDFKGSGPLVQSLLTKDVEGLKMSIEFNGVMPGDPYMKVLGEYALLHNTGVQGLADHHKVDVPTLRNWVKFHTQPMQYGSGSNTSEANGISEGSKLTQTVYETAFAKALPHTAKVLSVLKERAKYLSLMASMSSNTQLQDLLYTNAAGVNCVITPLSDGKQNDGVGFVHEFKILGHQMAIPCKIIDTQNHGVKTIAAGSHNVDSALLWTILKLFEYQIYTVHDDFRVSIRHEDELQMVATAVIKMFWEDKGLFNRYLTQVYSSAAKILGDYSLGIEEVEPEELDWDSVTRVLF